MNVTAFAQTAGEVMFVGLNSESPDGISFVTFVPLPDGTTIYFNDNEWNGSFIGSGGAFNNAGEGAVTWTNNTGNAISAGTVITIVGANNLPSVNIGVVSESEAGFNVEDDNEVVYMFLGTDDYAPVTFLSAIANDGFTFGTLAGTGLTSGVNAINITGDEDVMVYTGSTVCTSSVSTCSAEIANSANWATDDGAGTDRNDGQFPDYPDDVPANIYGTVFESLTYYSRNATSGGDWDDPNSWTTISDGTGGPLGLGIWPASADNVVILPGHTITVDANTDNQASGISPDGLGRSNVGSFTSSGSQMFYHTGDIFAGGTLTFSTAAMLEGNTGVESGGTINVSGDFVNLGYLETSSGASLDFDDDMILSGNSSTIINSTITGSDDIYIDWTDATLCGGGVINLGNGGPNPTVQFFNGATSAQICSRFSITCTANCGAFDDGSPSGGFISGNTGPGGVGNLTNNPLWLRADDLALPDGASVASWADVSGNGLVAISTGVASEEPVFQDNTVNGLPSLFFDGGDYLNLGAPAILDLIPGTDSWSFFIAYQVTGATPQGTFFSKATSDGGTRQYQYTIDDNAGTSRFTSYIGGNGTIGSVVATNNWFISSHANDATQKDSWTNESSNFAGAGVGTGLVADTEVLVGARRDSGPTTGAGFHLTGSIAELAMYGVEVNTAQRIIVSNYLAAKYGITLNANDVYTMDNAGNGNYDFDVIGIGQVSGGNNTDALGTGMVRIWNPQDLDNNEFLMAGHDNGALFGTLSDVDGVEIQERLVRIWRVSETGDVGNVSLSFDLDFLSGTPIGSDLRLIIDRNGNGFSDNDVAPVAGSFSGNKMVFSGVDLQNGDRFTLGNTNLAELLPVELLSFRADTDNEQVYLYWSTASELNNDYFTIERSDNGMEWHVLHTVDGAGTSKDRTNYSSVDGNPFSGTSYYRLKQTDFDGTFSYSRTISVNVDPDEDFLIFPNPASNHFTIAFPSKFQVSQIRMFNQLGQDISVSFEKGRNNEISVITNELPRGVYLVQVDDGRNIKTRRLMIVDK